MLKLQASLGLAIALALSTSQIAVAANGDRTISPSPTANTFIAQIPHNQTTIYVSSSGSDAPGSGTQARPFRTITAALNSNPQPGTTIRLAPGTYSAGEVFPLKLAPGVKLKGDGNKKGQGIIIQGGGRFVSPTFASQNVAILAAHNSHIGGITIINNNSRGYGVWVEGRRNVAIANNTFINNTHDGVFLTGDAHALVAYNIFTKNKGSGMSAVGTSSGEIRGNWFDDTGFGLSIGQRSQVFLKGNRIINNQDGVVISNLATPILRGNEIANNRRDGVVVIKDRNGHPIPNLGTAGSPGKNTFRSNRRKDINNASGATVVAAGNQLNRARVAGAIDTVAANVATRLPSVNPSNGNSNRSNPPIANPNDRLIGASPVVAIPSNNSQFPTEILIERETADHKIILPGDRPIALAPPLRYRVTVPIQTGETLAQVRRWVPDAFRLSYNGRTAIQAGAFGDRKVADERVEMLTKAGFRPSLENI